jgi:hypothetical protein
MNNVVMNAKPQIDVAVLMHREPVQGPMARWQTSRWVLGDVVLQEASFGQTVRCLRDTPDASQWLYPGRTVQLFPDDAEGYWLNATSPTPCWFVMWRLIDVEGQEARAEPQAVSLSYHDAGRWLDAQETVETVPAPADVVAWIREFAEHHYVPEVKKRQRPQSFQGLTDRFGQPVSVSTTEKRKGPGGQGA